MRLTRVLVRATAAVATVGVVTAGVVTAGVVTAGVVYARSARRLGRLHATAVEQVAVPHDRASVARGAHLATIATCVLCHGADLGGAVYSDDPWVGTVAGPNLTRGRGGIGGARSDADLVRAIRHGVRRDGTSLVVMPSEVYVRLGARDLGALLAYIRRLPPVDREVPATRFGPVGRTLLAAGKLNILVADKTPALPLGPGTPPAPNAEYGRYLADVTGCHGCHGFGLSGGRVAGPPGFPPSANLTPAGALGRWSERDFVRAMRTGARPDGTRIDPFMPWPVYARMTDDELRALWRYIHAAPARATGTK